MCVLLVCVACPPQIHRLNPLNIHQTVKVDLIREHNSFGFSFIGPNPGDPPTGWRLAVSTRARATSSLIHLLSPCDHPAIA